VGVHSELWSYEIAGGSAGAVTSEATSEVTGSTSATS
jgi:hypothetical protein